MTVVFSLTPVSQGPGKLGGDFAVCFIYIFFSPYCTYKQGISDSSFFVCIYVLFKSSKVNFRNIQMLMLLPHNFPAAYLLQLGQTRFTNASLL